MIVSTTEAQRFFLLGLRITTLPPPCIRRVDGDRDDETISTTLLRMNSNRSTLSALVLFAFNWVKPRKNLCASASLR